MQFKEQKNVKVKYNIFFDMKITDEKIRLFGYTLETYFGGESKAPHKIEINRVC